MDTKNDDSAGSDSLDKSLQKKCVVDDVGQGEGLKQECNSENSATNNKTDTDTTITKTVTDDRLENSTNEHKTEKTVGDGGIGGGGGGGGGLGGGGGGGGGVGASGVGIKGGNSGGSGSVTNTSSTINDEAKTQAQHQQKQENLLSTRTDTLTENTIASNNSIATNNNNNNNTTNAFETKVKQISKNLKETTLAESANKKITIEDSTSSSSLSIASTVSSSSSSSSSSTEFEQVMPSCSSKIIVDKITATTSGHHKESELDSSLLGVNESLDDLDQRSKKVRFHPDVKENDGGNRVIPKKKKKIKVPTTTTGDDTTGGEQCTTGADDEMELDDEDDEDEFDLAKTIAEAEEHLKIHPLTFVSSNSKSDSACRVNGLLNEEDLPQLSESSEEEDYYEGVRPENGIERILGKQIKAGKVEYLLRYADRPGLLWETDEFVTEKCPNLLDKYEEVRERRQHRLMRYVAKRQNLRQRYTDF